MKNFELKELECGHRHLVARRRPVDCGAACPWRERPRSPGEFECSAHGGRFPCRERDCGHGDCAERRQPVCSACGHAISGAFESRVVRGLTKAVCLACGSAGDDAGLAGDS